MAYLVGTTLCDRYFLRELVDSGGMADVYMAWDKLRATKMAVKVLRWDSSKAKNDAYRGFRVEAELLQKLAHPNIVRIYEFRKEGEITFFVMDWIEGGHNLRREIEQRGKPFPLDEISDIVLSVCTALDFAHKHNVFHCDVKPANILLEDNRVLLSDFGVARLASGIGSGGTPEFMAPEQFPKYYPKARVGAYTDVYGLGVTLYQLLSGGRLPFNGDSTGTPGTTKREKIGWEHCNLSLPPLQHVNPNVQKPVVQVIETAMNKEPGRRFSSVIELREAYEQGCKMKANNRGVIAAILEPADGSFPQFDHRQTPLVEIKTSTEALRESRPVIKGPYLLVRSGEYEGKTIALQGEEFMIGRAKYTQLRLGEASVSRKHATIIRTRGEVYIRDENSSLGTYVNEQRITGAVPLREGDVIRIGYQQVFEYRGK